ncbi:Zn-ribbon domain-containing OB-fold protein [Paraburkholderia graminis]
MTTDHIDRKISDPAPNPGDEPYFDAASEGRLMIKRCNACQQPHHYPRALCPFCWSNDVEWIATNGTGTIYAFSVTRRGTPTPYCIAYVTLDDGPTMLTNIVDTDLDRVRIGQRVRVVCKKSEGGFSIPMFTPIHDQQA